MMGRFFAPSEPAAPIGADDLRQAARSLRRTKFREGYDVAEVDAFVIEAVAALDAAARAQVPGLTADDVLNRRFRTTKFREGYDQDEVDDLLDRVDRGLRGAGRG